MADNLHESIRVLTAPGGLYDQLHAIAGYHHFVAQAAHSEGLAGFADRIVSAGMLIEYFKRGPETSAMTADALRKTLPDVHWLCSHSEAISIIVGNPHTARLLNNGLRAPEFLMVVQTAEDIAHCRPFGHAA